MLPHDIEVLLNQRHIRPVLVDDLGRDALILVQHGIALIDTEAAMSRAGAIGRFVEATIPVTGKAATSAA